MVEDHRGIPHISKELCDWLVKTFPLSEPNENESYGQLMTRAGECKVVRKLLHEHEQQQN